MSDMPDKLEEKLERNSEAYRLNKLLDILLQADLKCLDEICLKMAKNQPAHSPDKIS